MSDLYRAISEPVRRSILDVLCERNDQTLFEVCARLAMAHDVTLTRQAVSQHLQMLENAGLVVSYREGRYKYHRIDTAPLVEITKRWQQPSSPRSNA